MYSLYSCIYDIFKLITISKIYNGIGLQTARGSGTSEYIRTEESQLQRQEVRN